MGDSIELTAAGDYSFNWSSGDSTANIRILQSGNYDVTATDTLGCRDVITSYSIHYTKLYDDEGFIEKCIAERDYEELDLFIIKSILSD